MSNVTERNVLVEIQDYNGNKERQFPLTKATNIIGLKNFIDDNTSGMAEENEKYSKALRLLALNPYIVDDTTGDIYRIGIDNGELYHVKVDSGILDILDTVVNAIN